MGKQPSRSLGAARAVLAVGLAAALCGAGEGPPPEGDRGIAAEYPGDAGMERDPAVLLVERFEDDLPSVKKRWTEVSDEDGKVLSLSKDVPPGSAGKQSLRMTATEGENHGGHLWKLFDAGVDQMFSRFYVKFAPDHPYVHHFVKIGAWKDSPRWPQGEAGYRPDGAKSFQTGIEPGDGWGRHPPPGAWFLYTYWHEMRSWQGPDGRSFYGNGFAPEKPEIAPRGEWTCVEFMVKANSKPDLHDGGQAFWIDGRLVGRWAPGTPKGAWVKDHYDIGAGDPFEGFNWRTTGDVKINTFWLLYYLFTTDDYRARNAAWNKAHPDDRVNEKTAGVWFDDVVVATKHVGPRRGK